MHDPFAEWVTVAEAARMKKVTPNSVRVAIRQGRLESLTKFDIRLVSRTALAGWHISNRGPKKKREES